jgi:hypothetical protein
MKILLISSLSSIVKGVYFWKDGGVISEIVPLSTRIDLHTDLFPSQRVVRWQVLPLHLHRLAPDLVRYFRGVLLQSGQLSVHSLDHSSIPIFCERRPLLVNKGSKAHKLPITLFQILTRNFAGHVIASQKVHSHLAVPNGMPTLRTFVKLLEVW